MATPNSLIRALGDLEGTVRGMADQWKSQETAAAAARKALYERFEGLSAQVGQMASKIDGAIQDVAELKNDLDDNVMPTISAYNTDIARRGGVMWASKLFWAFILAVGTVVGFAGHLIESYLGRG